ncbi:MAG TPA: lysophospholipase [Tenuifilaceae bacterium]|nr:lysophospholipase [Tenuifilaceae bacterium]HPW27023.1 lysophospholipase [Tenuifilaceae bacterium]
MEPREIELKLKTGENIYAWHLSPHSSPIAVICLCHGWGEHSLRYKHWADRFVANGYGFFAWDHYGHGQSDGLQGHIKSYEIFMEEVNLALSKASTLFPGCPLVLYGHSMGGNIAINFAIREGTKYQLLIATSPWLKLVKNSSGFLNFLVKLLNLLVPSLQIKAPVKAEDISHVPEVVESYKTDPLNHGKITPRLMSEMNKASRYAMNNIDKMKDPFLLIHGVQDPITRYEESYKLSQRASNCSFIPFRDMYHELHNETISTEIFRVISEWISGNLEI